MPIHNIDIHSKSDCQELMNRISQTLSASKPNILAHISHYPQPFLQNDTHIFEWLTPAVLSNGTKYYLLEPHLLKIKRILFNYNIARIAALSDSTIRTLYLDQIKPLRIPSRPLPHRKPPETRLIWIRDNAKTFQEIKQRHGSVWHFIETNLGGSLFNHTHGCYIHPNDADLLRCFSGGKFKLKGVGLAICCEFFKNIGIDEFKPDGHIITFLNRINLDISKARVSRRPDYVRGIGIKIADTLQKPRAFVDSHMWVFCAEGKGEMCTEKNPKCDLCLLKMKQPQFCQGA